MSSGELLLLFSVELGGEVLFLLENNGGNPLVCGGTDGGADGGGSCGWYACCVEL